MLRIPNIIYKDMEITTVIFFGALVSTTGVALWAERVGYIFTEWRQPLFNFKPFNCRPCFTFWLTFLVHGFMFLAATPLDWWFVIAISLVPAFVNFLILKSQIKVT